MCAVFNKTELILDHQFDQKTSRHYLNGAVSVLHCHHYSTLYTQLAIDSGETELLEDVSEETFFNLLVNYFEEYGIEEVEERVEIAVQYFAAVGLGKMNVIYLGETSGEIELLVSHLDSGWIKKWNNYDKPVNHIGAGYISAMFSAVNDEDMGTYKAMEIQSIVMGAETSKFKVFKEA
jgi:predicted hydrocarbon binding protein